MEVSIQKLPKSRIKLTIKVSPIAMGEYFAQALQRLAASFVIEGFRPGKAPLSLVEQKIGPDKIQSEVLQIALPLTYQNAIQQEKLVPLESPKVNVKEFGKGKALVYEAEVDVMPEVKIADYRQLKIKSQKGGRQAKIKITEKDIETTLKQLQRQTADVKPVERLAQKGDLVEIDFESFLGEKPLPEGKSQNHPLVIGQGQFVPEFEEKLIGMKRGEERKFSIKFPGHFHNKELAGKEISFRVLMKEIKEIILPKTDDVWAAKLGKKNLKDLKNSIKESLFKEEERKRGERVEQEIIDKVTQVSETEIPESLVFAETQRLLQNLIYQVESKGLKFEDYLKGLKKSQEELISGLKKGAGQNVKVGLVLGAIKKKEGIEVKEEEVEEEIKKLEEQKIQVKDEERLRIKNVLEIRKTVERLKRIVDKGY